LMKLVRGAIAAFVGLLGFTGAWFFVLSDLYAQQFEVHGVVLRIGVLGIATLVFSDHWIHDRAPYDQDRAEPAPLVGKPSPEYACGRSDSAVLLD